MALKPGFKWKIYSYRDGATGKIQTYRRQVPVGAVRRGRKPAARRGELKEGFKWARLSWTDSKTGEVKYYRRQVPVGTVRHDRKAVTRVGRPPKYAGKVPYTTHTYFSKKLGRQVTYKRYAKPGAGRGSRKLGRPVKKISSRSKGQKLQNRVYQILRKIGVPQKKIHEDEIIRGYSNEWRTDLYLGLPSYPRIIIECKNIKTGGNFDTSLSIGYRTLNDLRLNWPRCKFFIVVTQEGSGITTKSATQKHRGKDYRKLFEGIKVGFININERDDLTNLKKAVKSLN